MRFGARDRRLISWLASLAILLGALAPTVSHALRAGSPAAWAGTCLGLFAALHAPAGAAPAADGGDAAVAGGMACPYCAWQAHGMALPPAPVQAAVPALWSRAPALPDQAAPQGAPTWVAALPRAPPLGG